MALSAITALHPSFSSKAATYLVHLLNATCLHGKIQFAPATTNFVLYITLALQFKLTKLASEKCM